MANTKSSGNRRKPGELVEEKTKYSWEQGYSNLTMQVRGGTLGVAPRGSSSQGDELFVEYNRKTKTMIAVASQTTQPQSQTQPEWARSN